jgi:hypothetical protein
MPQPILLMLWAACLAALASVFGSIAGGLTWWLGRGSGTAVGLRAVEALASITGRSFSRTVTGVVVGATDGLVLATAVIVLLLLFEPTRAQLASPAFLAASLILAVVLGGMAIVLGSLAHLLIWARERGRFAIAGFAFAFFVVALLAGRMRVGYPLLLGLLAGIVFGTLAGLFIKPPTVDSSDPAKPSQRAESSDTSFTAAPPKSPPRRSE